MKLFELNSLPQLCVLAVVCGMLASEEEKFVFPDKSIVATATNDHRVTAGDAFASLTPLSPLVD